MNIKIITAPTSEPITLAEAKAQIRVTHDNEDTYISRLITVARQSAETITGRALAYRTMELTLDVFPEVIVLPYPPVEEVVSIKYTDSDDIEHTLDIDDYIVHTDMPTKIVPAYNTDFPSVELKPIGAVKVRYKAGYKADGDDPEFILPEEIKQGILLLISNYYEYREDILSRGHIPKAVPFGVNALLTPYQVYMEDY